MENAGIRQAKPLREVDLLVAASRTILDPRTRDHIRSMAKDGLDWERLIHLSRVHGTRPLLYRSLKTVCADLLPPDVLRTLHAHYCASVLQNARSVSALVEIISALNARGIRVLPLKGPTLAVLAYDDVMLREFGDLDFLVRKRDLERTSDVLRELGFVFMKNKDRSERGYHALVREGDGVFVDVQWMMTADHFSFAFEHPALWERTYPVVVKGAEIRGFTPEALLLVLCIHGSKHVWSQLKWTCDIVELLRRFPQLDWEWTMRASRELGCRRILALGMFLARDFLGAPIPDHVIDRSGRDAAIEDLAFRLIQGIRSGVEPDTRTSLTLPDSLLLHDRRLPYSLYLCASIAPNDLHLLGQFPGSFRALYRALLPIRRIVRSGLPAPRLKAAVSDWLERLR